MRVTRSLVLFVALLAACGGGNSPTGSGSTGSGSGGAGSGGAPPDIGTWLGPLQFGTTDNEAAYGALVDSQSNAFVFGATHGQLVPEGDPTQSQWFVTRLSASGRRVWTHQWTTGAAVRGALGKDDALFIAGQGGVARLNAAGDMGWHVLGDSNVMDVAVGPDGDVYAAGLTGNQQKSGAMQLPAIGALGDTYDGFITRLDPATGAARWEMLVGTELTDWITGIAVGPGGEMFVSGATQGLFPGAASVSLEGSPFLMRIGADGKLGWVQELTSTGTANMGLSVRLDPSGAPWMVSGSGPSVLTKHDPATGAVVWTRAFDDIGGAVGDLAFDATGRAWLATTLGTANALASVLVVDSSGTVVASRFVADSPSHGKNGGDLLGQSTSKGLGITFAPDHSAYLVGKTRGDLPGTFNVASPLATTPPGDDAFVVKLGADLVVQGVTLQATPALLSLAAGATGTVQVSPVDAYGLPVAGMVTWTSSLPAIATVDSSGVVTGVANGRSNLVPTLDRLRGAPTVVKVGSGGGAVLFGTNHGDVPRAATLDAAGKLVIGGSTDEAFDGQTFFGAHDAFLAKLADDGSLTWIAQTGGSDDDAIRRLASDAKGNTYAVADQTAALPGGGIDVDVVSDDPGGKRRWTFTLPPVPNGGRALTDLAVTADGRLYVGGTSGGHTLILELDPATGQELWSFAGLNNEPSNFVFERLGVDTKGDLLLTGHFGESVFYSMKLTRATGVAAWFAMPYDASFQPPRGMAMDPGGDFYVGTATPIGTDGSGLYVGMAGAVTRLSGADGSIVWQTPVLPPGVKPSPNDVPLINVAAVARGADGTIYATGSIVKGSLVFTGGAHGGYDAYLVAIDPSGAVKWGRQIGSDANDYGTALALRTNGDITVVGYTFGDFDGVSRRGLRSAESCDVFVVSFGPDGTQR
ncbi:MAG: PQQ-binding-like beta-propeller repeat protein [Byssovorax sp.]